MRVRWLGVFMCLVVFALACEDDPAPNAGSWLRSESPQSVEDAKLPALIAAEDLRLMLPRFERKDPYTWGRTTLSVPGYVSAVVIDRKTSKKIATWILFDRGREPESVLGLRSLAQTRRGVPFERVHDGLVRLFVLDRFEVTLQSHDPILASASVLDELVEQLRIRSFSKHWAKLQAPPEAP